MPCTSLSSSYSLYTMSSTPTSCGNHIASTAQCDTTGTLQLSASVPCVLSYFRLLTVNSYSHWAEKRLSHSPPDRAHERESKAHRRNFWKDRGFGLRPAVPIPIPIRFSQLVVVSLYRPTVPLIEHSSQSPSLCCAVQHQHDVHSNLVTCSGVSPKRQTLRTA
jgi:hypothetical protein